MEESRFKPDNKYFTKALWVEMTITAALVLFIAIIHLIIYLAGGDPQAPAILWLVSGIGLGLMWLIATPIARLWINNLEYFVHEDRIQIYKGILTKTQQNIPFRAITDFALERTLYDRFLGLGSVKIQTAGQSTSPAGSEGKLGGLIDYETYHTALREKVKKLHDTSVSVGVSEAPARPRKDIMEQILDELKKIRKNTEQ